MLNVRDYGATGNGVDDDTDAIQAVINKALGTTAIPTTAGTLYAVSSVFLPAGTYKITRPLYVRGAMYLKFFGEGGSTRLYPVGEMASVLDINGVACCEFCDFRIEGNKIDEEIENAIHFYWDGAIGRSVERCNFHDIQILGTRCVTGFRIGLLKSGVPIDTSTYDNITLYGYWLPGETTWWKHGFFVGTDVFANCLVHSFNNSSITHWSEGCHVSVTNFNLINGNFGGNGIDIAAHTLSYFSVQGARSEKSGRFLVSGTGYTESAANFSLADILFWPDSLNADGQVIQSTLNGMLSIRNLVIPPGPVAPVIWMNPGVSACLVLDGVTCTSSMEHFLSQASNLTDLSVRGFTTVNVDGTVQTMNRGLTVNGPVRWLDSGELSSANGGLTWRSVSDTVTTLVPPEGGPP